MGVCGWVSSRPLLGRDIGGSGGIGIGSLGLGGKLSSDLIISR